MGSVYILINLHYGNIFWPAISMASLAAFYYSYLFPGDILKYRSGEIAL